MASDPRKEPSTAPGLASASEDPSRASPRTPGQAVGVVREGAAASPRSGASPPDSGPSRPPTESARPTAEAVPRRGPLRAALAVLERVLAIAGAFFLVFHAGFGISEVVSGSMAPTLRGEAGRPDNDWYLYERISTRWGPPPRRSLIVFRSDEGVQIAKRVMGYGGETLRLVDGVLHVDGIPVPVEDATYLRAGRLRPRREGEGTRVEAGRLFVLGDNGKDSWDSRFFGGLRREQWRGRVVAVVWPPSRWRWLW
ncbi:MAG: signal peptidase I [Planctomycetota bacterium]|nr:MAG: signal peptidase I [Planctomycetota bacterium]